MAKYLYTKQRAIFYAAKGLNATAISKALLKEGLSYTPKSVSLLLRKLREGKNIARQPSAGRASKVTQRMKDIVDEQMQKDDETTAAEMDCILQKKASNFLEVLFCGVAENLDGLIVEEPIVK